MVNSRTKRKKYRVFCFSNGNIIVLNGKNQVPELQIKGWLGTWLEWVESLGYNPEGWKIELPGSPGTAKVIRTKRSDCCRFNWVLEDR